MKIKHLFLGIGVMVFASCAVDKTKKLDVDKELTYCDMQIHRALSELEKDGEPDYTMEPRNILAGERFWNCKKVSREEWTGGFWPGILWYDTKQLRMIRFGCWLRNIRSRWNFFQGFLHTIMIWVSWCFVVMGMVIV